MKMVNAKFIKKTTKSSPKVQRSFWAPPHIYEYLIKHNINVSEVCRSALQSKIELNKDVPKSVEMEQYTFKIDQRTLDQIKVCGINLGQTCREALESIYAEILLEERAKGLKK